MRFWGGGAPEESFDALYHSAWDETVVTAHRVVGDHSRAEELAQEAFTRAFDRWSRVCVHPNPVAWVKRVALNLSLDELRRHRRAAEPETTAAGVMRRRSPAIDEPSVEFGESDIDVAIDVRAALTVLSDKQRQAVALRYLVGCQEAEIAAIMGVNSGTVKTHLRRGLARLRQELGAEQIAAVDDAA